jgi:hypothetical protein
MRVLRHSAAMALITAALVYAPFVVPPRIVCANQGLGRPMPGQLDPPPSYIPLQFDLSGVFTGPSI